MAKQPRTGRETPPDDDEWHGIWAAVEKAHKGWPVVGPIVAIVTNWKALAAVAAIWGWFNQTAILEITKMLVEKNQ